MPPSGYRPYSKERGLVFSIDPRRQEVMKRRIWGLQTNLFDYIAAWKYSILGILDKGVRERRKAIDEHLFPPMNVPGTSDRTMVLLVNTNVTRETVLEHADEPARREIATALDKLDDENNFAGTDVRLFLCEGGAYLAFLPKDIKLWNYPDLASELLSTDPFKLEEINEGDLTFPSLTKTPQDLTPGNALFYERADNSFVLVEVDPESSFYASVVFPETLQAAPTMLNDYMRG